MNRHFICIIVFNSLNNQQAKRLSPGQLIFGRDKILPIKHKVDWELIRQQKQTQIKRDKTRENKNRVNHDYKVEDDVILTK